MPTKTEFNGILNKKKALFSAFSNKPDCYIIELDMESKTQVNFTKLMVLTKY